MFDEGKSMKEYMADAYDALLEEKREREKETETPADIKQKERESELFKEAEELLSLNILNEGISGEYIDLNKNISNKRTEIEKLYGITITEKSLEIVKNLFDKIGIESEVELSGMKEQYETEKRRISEETDKVIAEKTEAADKKYAALEEELEIAKTEFEKEFAREKAEYDYNLKRERKIAQEQRQSEVQSREEKLKTRETEVKERKKECQKSLEEIVSLQVAIENIPAQIDSARKEGEKRKETELSKLYKYESELEKKTQEHKLQALQDQYEHLMQKYNVLRDEIAAISEKLDQCNRESRNLTGDTVRYIGGINILNSDINTKNEQVNKK